jgi:general secretion pathway protein I
MIRRHSRGITLIECAVAVAILGVALASGLRAISALSSTTQRQADVTLAMWCAEGALIELRLRQQPPNVGRLQQSCTQAGQTLAVEIDTRTTPNASFRRVEATVTRGDVTLYRLTALMGPRN